MRTASTRAARSAEAAVERRRPGAVRWAGCCGSAARGPPTAGRPIVSSEKSAPPFWKAALRDAHDHVALAAEPLLRADGDALLVRLGAEHAHVADVRAQGIAAGGNGGAGLRTGRLDSAADRRTAARATAEKRSLHGPSSGAERIGPPGPRPGDGAHRIPPPGQPRLARELPLWTGYAEGTIPPEEGEQCSSAWCCWPRTSRTRARSSPSTSGRRGSPCTICRMATASFPSPIEMQPDVVVLDLSLPGIDGYSLAAALRAHPLTAPDPDRGPLRPRLSRGRATRA